MNSLQSETYSKLSYLKTILEDRDDYLHDIRLVDTNEKQLAIFVRKSYVTVHLFTRRTHMHTTLTTNDIIKLLHLLRNTEKSNEETIICYMESLLAK